MHDMVNLLKKSDYFCKTYGQFSINTWLESVSSAHVINVAYNPLFLHKYGIMTIVT